LKNLGVIGRGWLGKPLVSELKKNGNFHLWCTSYHDQSEELKHDGISYSCLDIKNVTELPKELLLCEILIYTIPPLPLDIVKSFLERIPSDKKMIFLSSTSVYGKGLGEVDENIFLNVHNTSSPLLIETENFIRSHFKTSTILRLGGLYGQDRHPIFFLTGKKDLTTASEWLHLVSQNDCVKAILSVLDQNIWNETINIISDLRIKKEIYYTTLANKLSLTAPQYLPAVALSHETKISNQKSKRLLGMKYENPDDYARL
jgi:nucleoside-diphosphate-sugar epimerase